MNKRNKWLCIAAGLALCTAVLMVAGCGQRTEDVPVVAQQPVQVAPQQVQYVQAPAPVYVAPAPVYVQHDNSLVTGMLLGHMMSGGYSHHSVITHRTVIYHNYSRSYYRRR